MTFRDVIAAAWLALLRERRSGGARGRGFEPRPDLASSAGNSGEESEDENGGKKRS